VVDVTEATATRRDKAVKACLLIAEASAQLVPELGKAAMITSVANMDGEGMTELQKYARKLGIGQGIIEPTDDEKAELEKAAQEQSSNHLSQRKSLPPRKPKRLKRRQSRKPQAPGSRPHRPRQSVVRKPRPKHRMGSTHSTRRADTDKKLAEAEHIRTKTQHLPQELAIEATNADTNRLKAKHGAFAGLAKLFAPRKSA
jgi:hypothetical protein